MKTNFKKSENIKIDEDEMIDEKRDLTKEEFEEFIHKSGAKGSFMVYRSTKKDEELGIDEL
jgi:hypothetical protein|tara:strand:+ start:3879 stop:4061 length:183 start_codon:yes stop_codon:yes gene_type:complete